MMTTMKRSAGSAGQGQGAPLSLFCFHHAGGAAHFYYRWTRGLAQVADVAAIELPGRASRIREPLVKRLDLLVEKLADALEPSLARPYALFGHSLGALIAFSVARELRRRGGPLPVHLFVSAFGGPSMPRRLPPIHGLSDGDLLAQVQARYGAFAEEVAQNAELVALLAPIVRADLELYETHQYRVEPPLDTPISALIGGRDPAVSVADMELWGRESRHELTLDVFDGGHFFVQSREAAVLELIARRLRPHARGRRADQVALGGTPA
jgi:medium-chain acyl-[acyl-carrier-protein] hydrolase